MGFRTSEERERVSRSRSNQACMSSRSGLLFSWRTARRSSALRPLMARSISNSASRRLTASSAIGETGLPFWPSRTVFSMSASSKKPRRAWAKQDAGEGGQMLLRMLAASVARGVIDRRRRRRSGEGAVIADIGPDTPGHALTFCQDADGGVVAMQALGREHMTLDQVEERHDGEGPVADLVGQRRQRQVDPLALEARALAVERDMHAELVEQDGRQQLRADEAARRGMERRGRLADLLAIAAGELFPHRLDDLEATRDLLQRLGHILADLRQPRSAAAGAGRRSLDNDALVFDVVRPGLAYRSLAREGADFLRFRRRGLRGKLILARRGDELFELQFKLLDQPRRALGALPVQFAFELLDPQLEMRD